MCLCVPFWVIFPFIFSYYYNHYRQNDDYLVFYIWVNITTIWFCMQRKTDRRRVWAADRPTQLDSVQGVPNTHLHKKNILMILIWKVISEKMGEWEILLIKLRYREREIEGGKESQSLRDDDTLALCIVFFFSVYHFWFDICMRFVCICVCMWIDIASMSVCIAFFLSFCFFFSSIIILFASKPSSRYYTTIYQSIEPKR